MDTAEAERQHAEDSETDSGTDAEAPADAGPHAQPTSKGKVTKGQITGADELEQEPTLDPSTVNAVMKALSSALGWGAGKHFVPMNYTQGIPPMAENSREIEALTDDELTALLRAAREASHAEPLFLMAGTGTRPSEAFGLTWDRVDLDARRLIISRKLTYVNKDHYWLESLTKSARERTPPIPNWLVTLLAQQKKTQERLGTYSSTGFVFTTDAGNPIDARWYLNDRVKPAALRAGIDPARVTNYLMRHTYATRFTENDVGKITTLQALRGHSSVRVTQDLYVHPARPPSNAPPSRIRRCSRTSSRARGPTTDQRIRVGIVTWRSRP